MEGLASWDEVSLGLHSAMDQIDKVLEQVQHISGKMIASLMSRCYSLMRLG